MQRLFTWGAGFGRLAARRGIAACAAALVLAAGCFPPQDDDDTESPSVSGALTIRGVTPAAPTGDTARLRGDDARKLAELFTGKSRGTAADNIRVGEGILSLQREFEPAGRQTLKEIIARHPQLELAAIRELTPQGPFLVAIGAAESAEQTRAALAVLQQDAAVRAAEPNRVLRPLQTGQTLRPNDPSYPDQQWQFDMIGLTRAWAITTGSPDIRVAVLDDGVIQHPDLAANLLPGFDFIRGTNDPTAPPTAANNRANTHGTHVSGTVAAVGNNQLGVTGVTWQCRIVPCRVIRARADGEGGNAFDLAAAIRWAAGLAVTDLPANPNPCRVINMSLGGLDGPQCTPDPPTTALDDAVAAAEAAGAVCVAAAGNEAQECPAPQSSSPANQRNVIAVAAVGRNRERAEYSNQASTNFIAAPGGNANDLLSTYFEEPFNGQRTPTYQNSQGTSMATPHIAGVVALMLSANPALTPAQVREILQNTAEDLGAPGRDDIFGFGLVRADRAVEAAANLAAQPSQKSLTAEPLVTPLIRATPDPVELNGSQTSQTVTISNLGAGSVTFQSGSKHEETGGNWLSVAFPAPGTPVPFELTVSVSRAGLATGRYQGHVELQTSAGRTVIDVVLVVPGLIDIGDIKVSLINPADGAEVASTVTNAANGYRYSLTDFPAGEYLVVATSLSEGITQYRGFYPNLIESHPINIDRPVTLTAFPVDRASGSVRQRQASGTAIAGGLLAAVFEAGSGEPISGATVSVAGGPAAETDVDGQAAVAGVSGPVTITAAAPGYSTMSFVGINSEYVEFELEAAGVRGAEVNLSVTATGLAAGESGVVSVIVDEEIRDFAAVTAAAPSATLAVEPDRDLSLAVVVTNGAGTVTKWNLVEIEPLFENDTVEIAAEAVSAAGPTTGTLQGPGLLGQAGTTYDVLALALGDSDKRYVLGAQLGVPIGQPYSLSRANLGAALGDVIVGQIVAIVRDGNASASELVTRAKLTGLPGSFSGTFRAPPVLAEPAGGATGVPRTPTLRFTGAVGGAVSAVVIHGPDEFVWEIFVPAGAGSITLPELGAGGLSAATAYEWHVEDYVVADFSFDKFSLDFRDFAQSATESAPLSFTTAP